MPEPVSASPAVSLVSDGAGLAAMLGDLAGAPCIGADLEGDGLYRYRSRLCVLQLATPDRIWIVDTLAIWDPVSVGVLLGPAGPTKILHDAAFDARLLRESGVALDNVFDTSVAARFLGEKNTGLGSLLAARCGLNVAKGLQKADWGKRPLDEQALVYLADDVRHLFALETSLRADVERLGIGEAVDTETRHMLARAQIEPVTGPAWLRVKGVRELAPEAQGVVRALVELRDGLARARDVPAFRVFADALILELAAARPATVEALSKVRGLRAQAGTVPPRALFDAVQKGAQEPPSPAELATEPPPSREQRALERSREKALGAWRRAQAELRGVDPQVVLPGHCLSDLAERGATRAEELEAIAGFGKFRVVRDGEALLRVVREAEAVGVGGGGTSKGSPDRDVATIDQLVEEFGNCVAAQSRCVEQGDAEEGNSYARRYIKAFEKLRSHGAAGRDALAVLLHDARADVRVMAAAFLLRHTETRARAVLEVESSKAGLAAFGARQALARWEDGTWALDPE